MAITVSGTKITFETTASSVARARRTVLTTTGDALTTFKFTVERNPIALRVGSTAGGLEIVPDQVFDVGEHFISVAPSLAPALTPPSFTYYIEFFNPNVGFAVVKDFEHIGSGELSIDAPWAALNIPKIRMQQSLNVVWLFCEGYQPRVLERRGDNSYGLRAFQPVDGPFEPINLTDTTLTSSALSGYAIITSSAPIFYENDVGQLLKLSFAGQYEEATFNSVDDVTDAIKVTGVGESRKFIYKFRGDTVNLTAVLEQSIGNELSYSAIAEHTITGDSPFFYDDELDNQIVYYRLRVSAYTSGSTLGILSYVGGTSEGIARIREVNADNSVDVDIIEPFSSTESTVNWYWGSWGDRFGWPTCVAMKDGRLAVGRGDRYWLSKSDDFESFGIGSLDDDALSRSLTGAAQNKMRWMADINQLVAATAMNEHVITSGSEDLVLLPSNVHSKILKRRGAANINPVIVDEKIVYVSKNGRRLLLLETNGDNAEIVDLTRYHPDICGEGGFVEIAYQKEPMPRIWCVCADGRAVHLTLNVEENVAAWAIYPAANGGLVESITVLPTGDEDAVYMSIKRTIDGVDKRYIERVATERYEEIEQAVVLQSSYQITKGNSVTSVSVPHLAGEDNIYIWGDGRQSGPYTVASNGDITLEYAMSKYAIGYLTEGRYKSSRLDYGGQMGTAITANKAITDVGLILDDTPGGALGYGRDFDSARRYLLPDIQTGTMFDGAVEVHNGVQRVEIERGEDLDTRLCIVMPSAGPASVLAVVPYMEVNER